MIAAGLPAVCYAKHPTEDRVIVIIRGEMGYLKLHHQGYSAEQLNAAMEVTPAQAEAMLAGSMFGWSCPGADPSTYNEDGTPRRELRHG